MSRARLQRPRRARDAGRPTAPPRRRRSNPFVWLLRHLQVLTASLGRISRQPLGSLMTVAVIGIAVALPAGLHLTVSHVQGLAASWEGGASISLYLDAGTGAQTASELAQRLRDRDEIAEVQLIGAELALAEFRELSGFGEALDLLEENPLPAVLLVRPDPASSGAEDVERLTEELSGIAAVDIARADLQWLQRLRAITRIAERAILILAVLLAAAVLLVVGNTIRLEVQNRHQEIEISKLVGATDGFIRRPFLYEGFWYGLFGGLLAATLVSLAMLLLRDPIAQLAGLYRSEFRLTGDSPLTLGVVLIGTPALGLLGSWLAVGRQLRRFRPE
jgi:cell division transport system permease protein